MPIDPDLKDQLDNEEITCVQKWMTDADADLICEVIKKNKCTKLVLARNDIADEGAKKIAAAMTTNTSIKFLSIAGNKITDEGQAAFAEVLQKNTTLTNFFLSDNMAITEKACDELFAVNDKREKPLTDNLYGLVLHHKSPKWRAAVEAKKEKEKAEKAAGKKKG